MTHALVTQDTTVGSEHEDDSESEGEHHGSLLVCNGGGKLHLVTEEKVSATEKIKVSITKTLKYIRENRRKLAAVVALWMAFLVAMMAVSLLSPFFPQEVPLAPWRSIAPVAMCDHFWEVTTVLSWRPEGRLREGQESFRPFAMRNMGSIGIISTINQFILR